MFRAILRGEGQQRWDYDEGYQREQITHGQKQIPAKVTVSRVNFSSFCDLLVLYYGL